jgi:hypothetical protein
VEIRRSDVHFTQIGRGVSAREGRIPHIPGVPRMPARMAVCGVGMDYQGIF